MLAILREISVTCFFASYLVVLVLELLRLLGRIPGRGLAVIGMMVVGLFTHVAYLVIRLASGTGTGPAGDRVGLLASWTEWLLMLALGMAVSYLVLYLRRPDTVIGLFFLPSILATIGLGLAVSDLPPFSRTEAVEVWRSIHGLGMVVGAGAVLIGFLSGVMYLAQSARLKKKKAGGTLLRLPTLEALGRLNRRCLVTSTTAVGLGMVAGFVMNLNRWGYVGWSDRGIWFSCLLFAWLTIATAVEFSYPSAQQSRKTLFLTLASFGFLVLTMVGILSSSHGRPDPKADVQKDAGFRSSDQSSLVASVTTPDSDRLGPGKLSREALER